MTLLYRVEDEIAIEMSRETWIEVEKAVIAWMEGGFLKFDRELTCFADAIRSHLQHLEAGKPSPPPSTNIDLI